MGVQCHSVNASEGVLESSTPDRFLFTEHHENILGRLKGLDVRSLGSGLSLANDRVDRACNIKQM